MCCCHDNHTSLFTVRPPSVCVCVFLRKSPHPGQAAFISLGPDKDPDWSPPLEPETGALASLLHLKPSTSQSEVTRVDEPAREEDALTPPWFPPPGGTTPPPPIKSASRLLSLLPLSLPPPPPIPWCPPGGQTVDSQQTVSKQACQSLTVRTVGRLLLIVSW